MISVQRHAEGPTLYGADPNVPGPDFWLLARSNWNEGEWSNRGGGGGEEPQLTTLLFLFFVGDSLNVSVKQLRSVRQTQASSQRPREENTTKSRCDAEPSASLEGMALIWTPEVLTDIPLSISRPLNVTCTRTRLINTHPANSFTLENHYVSMMGILNTNRQKERLAFL